MKGYTGSIAARAVFPLILVSMLFSYGACSDFRNFAPVNPEAAIEETLPAVVIRYDATYLLYAGEGQKVSFSLECVRGAGSDPLNFKVISPSEETVLEGSVESRLTGLFTFKAPEKGVYRLNTSPGRSYSRLHMQGVYSIALGRGEEGSRINFRLPEEDFYFWTPAGVETFRIRVWAHANEMVRARIINPAGIIVADEDNISRGQIFQITRDDFSEGQIWTLRLEKPTGEGNFSNVIVMFMGSALPPVISLRPEALLIPGED